MNKMMVCRTHFQSRGWVDTARKVSADSHLTGFPRTLAPLQRYNNKYLHPRVWPSRWFLCRYETEVISRVHHQMGICRVQKMLHLAIKQRARVQDIRTPNC